MEARSAEADSAQQRLADLHEDLEFVGGPELRGPPARGIAGGPAGRGPGFFLDPLPAAPCSSRTTFRC